MVKYFYNSFTDTDMVYWAAGFIIIAFILVWFIALEV